MREQWREIPGYEGVYEVSNHGRVRSLDRLVSMRSGRGPNAIFYQRYPGRLLRPGVASHGYPTVCLNTGGKRKSYCLHELVLATFVCPRPEGQEALHGDGDKGNNHLSNLRWGTRKENRADAARHGTIVRGENFKHAKLTRDAVILIRRSRGRVSQSALAARLGVSPAAVQAVHDGRTWDHISEVDNG